MSAPARSSKRLRDSTDDLQAFQPSASRPRLLPENDDGDADILGPLRAADVPAASIPASPAVGLCAPAGSALSLPLAPVPPLQRLFGSSTDSLYLDYEAEDPPLAGVPIAMCSSSSAATAVAPAPPPSPVSADDAPEAVALQLCATLDEPNVEGLAAAVRALAGGAAQARALADTVLAVEASGGLRTADGSRRRTPGGVFFALLRDVLSPAAYKAVLAPQAAARAAVLRRRAACSGGRRRGE